MRHCSYCAVCLVCSIAALLGGCAGAPGSAAPRRVQVQGSRLPEEGLRRDGSVSLAGLHASFASFLGAGWPEAWPASNPIADEEVFFVVGGRHAIVRIGAVEYAFFKHAGSVVKGHVVAIPVEKGVAASKVEKRLRYVAQIDGADSLVFEGLPTGATTEPAPGGQELTVSLAALKAGFVAFLSEKHGEAVLPSVDILAGEVTIELSDSEPWCLVGGVDFRIWNWRYPANEIRAAASFGWYPEGGPSGSTDLLTCVFVIDAANQLRCKSYEVRRFPMLPH